MSDMLGNPASIRSSSGWLKTNCTKSRFSTLLFVHRSQKSMARYTLKRDCSAGKRTLHQNWDSWVSFSRPCRIQVQYLEVTFPLMYTCVAHSLLHFRLVSWILVEKDWMWRDRRCGGDIKITDSGTTQPDTSAGSHHKTWGKRQLPGVKKLKIVLKRE